MCFSVASGGVQQLNQQDYLQLIRRLHTSMLGLLVLSDLESQAIAQVVGEHLKAKTRDDGIVTNEAALNEAWTTALQSELVDGVQAVAELINVRIARLVASRSEVHSHLTLEEFWVIFQETWQFVLDCEVVCRKMIVGLRGVIVSQVGLIIWIRSRLNTC
jgi:vacuolar protein sorting-associated protein 54